MTTTAILGLAAIVGIVVILVAAVVVYGVIRTSNNVRRVAELERETAREEIADRREARAIPVARVVTK